MVGAWATHLKNMRVSWDDYSQYMENPKMIQTTKASGPFLKMEDPQYGWFILNNPSKHWRFRGTSILGNLHMGISTGELSVERWFHQWKRILENSEERQRPINVLNSWSHAGWWEDWVTVNHFYTGFEPVDCSFPEPSTGFPQLTLWSYLKIDDMANTMGLYKWICNM